MPETEKKEKWITVGGKKIPVDPDKEAEEHIGDQVKPDTRGEKEHNTKEAQKAFVHRLNLNKSQLHYRDEVLFDKFEKSGIVYGFDGEFVRIMTKDNRKHERHLNNVFKKTEMLGDAHWDTLEDRVRVQILKATKVSINYLKHDWVRIPAIVRDKITKGVHPAGYSGNSGGVESTTPGVYNPINDHKTISEKIKETDDKDEKTDNKKV